MPSWSPRLLLQTAALLVAACAGAPAGPSDTEIVARLGATAPLLPLYRSLLPLETHAGTGTTPVIIVQIGDSHTANDGFSSRMRELFQARFGDAGRGVLPPGVPYRWYRPSRITVTSDGWSVVSSYGGDGGPFGITGLRQHADGPAAMTLSVDEAGDLGRNEVEVLRQPGSGTLDIELDTGARATIATAAPTPQAAWLPVPSTPDGHALTLHARGDAPVDVLAWSVSRNNPGVIYANLGTVGADIELMDAWDQTLVRQDLAHLAPAMMVLEFGTNDGFLDSTDLNAYATAFAARLRALSAAAPHAALLVLGPPDAYRHRHKDSIAPIACGDPNWTEPPNLGPIRGIERRIAAQEGAYYWDWQAAMGGPCTMLRWATTTPPMAAPDRVHLFAPGYQATAEELFRVIMDGYARYRAMWPPD
jgi:lysophospholipase L1-like esterase